ncbi:MAG: PP0621 family protein [Burkholderiales bacterium]
MARLILLAAAIAVFVWLVRRASQERAGKGVPPDAPADLVACAHCGVLVPRSEARSAAGAHYCSEAHARLGPRRP